MTDLDWRLFMKKHSKDSSTNQEKTLSKASWQWTNCELQSALDQWEKLSSKALELSPDEKRLKEIQKMLLELKTQLDELSQK